MFGHQDDQKTDDQASNTSQPDNTAPAEPATAPLPDWPEPEVHHGQMMSVPTPSAGNNTDDSSEVASSEPAQSTPSVTSTSGSTDSDSDLLGIKQQALQQLQPLVTQLDQSPEEKFRTLMMMIQASDDQSLIKSAYDSANSISDEKSKAQALLDIVNEINYFTHPHES